MIWWLVCRKTRRQIEVCFYPWYNHLWLTGLKITTNELTTSPTPINFWSEKKNGIKVHHYLLSLLQAHAPSPAKCVARPSSTSTIWRNTDACILGRNPSSARSAASASPTPAPTPSTWITATSTASPRTPRMNRNSVASPRLFSSARSITNCRCKHSKFLAGEDE